MAKGSIADSLFKMTQDKKVTTKPSFLDMLAPLMSIMYFSGMSEDIAKALGGNKGSLPSTDEMTNLTNVKNAAASINRDIRGPNQMGSPIVGQTALGPGGMTPEMILKLMMMMPGTFSGI